MWGCLQYRLGGGRDRTAISAANWVKLAAAPPTPSLLHPWAPGTALGPGARGAARHSVLRTPRLHLRGFGGSRAAHWAHSCQAAAMTVLGFSYSPPFRSQSSNSSRCKCEKQILRSEHSGRGAFFTLALASSASLPAISAASGHTRAFPRQLLPLPLSWFTNLSWMDMSVHLLLLRPRNAVLGWRVHLSVPILQAPTLLCVHENSPPPSASCSS